MKTTENTSAARDSANTFPACRSSMDARFAPDVFQCRACKLWASSLAAPDGRLRGETTLVEHNRRAALRSLREINNRRVLRVLADLTAGTTPSVCEVGCGYGWFLEDAGLFGMTAIGIEPDEAVAQSALQRGLNVRVGYFPESVADHELFDILAFNDVLEHLIDPSQVISQCHKHLKPGGLLAINFPSSDGIFFMLSCIACRFGVRSLFDRMWQRSFHSPHVSYFNDRNLERMACSQGFELVHSEPLKSVALKGMWQRLRMDGQAGIIPSALIYVALVIAYPLFAVLPSDIRFHVYKKRTV